MSYTDKRSLSDAFAIASVLTAVPYLVKIYEIMASQELFPFGIHPKTLPGLFGIFFSPFIHGDFPHLLTNTLPLLSLLTLLLWDARYHPVKTLFFIWFLSGLGTWILGDPQSIHVGASSIIFGLITFLALAGLFLQSWKAAFITLVVLFFFGGFIYGVFPQRAGVSWEGHLSGAVSGILCLTFTLKRRTSSHRQLGE